MKHEILTLDDLRIVLSKLEHYQRQQPPRVIATDGDGSNAVTCVEITEEPFLQSKEHPDNVGYPSEFHQANFNRDNFTVLEPAGTVFIYIGKK